MLLNMSRAKLRGIVAFWHKGGILVPRTPPTYGYGLACLARGTCCGSGSLFSTLQPFHINITIVESESRRTMNTLQQEALAADELQLATFGGMWHEFIATPYCRQITGRRI